MKPSSSFLGKCVTVLIGAGLSWATLTNPDIDRAVQRLIGNQRQVDGNDFDNFSGASLQQKHVSADGLPNDVEQLTQVLREMGATYLRVEKLSNPDNAWFRVRCDLARQGDPVKCCLESTQMTEIAALQDVLRAVRQGMPGAREYVSVPPPAGMY
jgi:hypothetical protein